MRTLALDLGTRCGFAFSKPGVPVYSGSVSFAPRKGEGPGARFLKFRRFLTENFPELDLLLYEEVRGHKATRAAQIYGGFEATVLAWAEARHIRYVGVHTGTLKRLTTGKGNAQKDEIIATIRLRGFDPADDNEADAIALLLLPLRELGLDAPEIGLGLLSAPTYSLP